MSTGEGLGAADVKDVSTLLRAVRAPRTQARKQRGLPVRIRPARTQWSGGGHWPERGPRARKTALRCMCELGIWRVDGLAACDGRNAVQALRPQAFPVVTAAPHGKQRLTQRPSKLCHPSATQHVSAGDQSSLSRLAAETPQDKAAKSATERLKWKAPRYARSIGKVDLEPLALLSIRRKHVTE